MKTVIIAAVLGAALMAAVAADDFVYQGSFLWNNIRAVVPSGNFLLCAFHDGIGVINLDLDFHKKKLFSKLELPDPPLRLHLFGSLLVAETEAGDICLVDVSDMAGMRFLGSFSPNEELFDLAVIGDYLYAAVEYDGVIRFDISHPDDVHWDDSSMAGIRVIALAAAGEYLFALDDYNGVLIYRGDSARIGAPVAELLLPLPGISLTLAGDTVYCGIKPTGVMVGSVADIQHPVYIEARASLLRGDDIGVVDRGLVLFNSIGGFELRYGAGDTIIDQFFPTEGIAGYGAVGSYGGRPYLIYPHAEKGFVAYDVEDPDLVQTDDPTWVYAYPGPITQLQFLHSRLHVIGTNNWYEMYDLSNPGNPVRTGRMINPPYKPAGFCTKGDTLYVADIPTSAFFIAVDDGYRDPSLVLPFFFVADSLTRPHLVPGYFGNGDLLYFYNDRVFNGSFRNDSIILPGIIHQSFYDGITAAAIDDTIVYQASTKGMLNVYVLDEDYAFQIVSSRSTPGRVNQILLSDTLMYLGAGGLVTASRADPLHPEYIDTRGEPGAVYEMYRFGTLLVCAARRGIFIYDISAGRPALLLSGGDMATIIAFDGAALAASDGYSVKIYTVPAVDVDDQAPIAFSSAALKLRGYPNPFNPTITLVVERLSSGARPVTIVVFDILGRSVRQLRLPSVADRTELVWDGCDGSGQPLPSGVYFVRAQSGSSQAVLRALLLK